MEHLEFLRKTGQWMIQQGFFSVVDQDQHPVDGLFWRVENPVFYLIFLLDGSRKGPAEWEEAIAGLAERMLENKEEMHCTRMVCLCIFTEEAYRKETMAFIREKQLSFDGPVQYIWWYFPLDRGQVLTGKDQPEKLLGLEKLLTAAAQGQAPQPAMAPAAEGEKPWATIIVFGLCALILAGMYLSGEKDRWIWAFGSGWEGVVEQGQYYRLLTSIFLHDGILHLAANGIYLFYFGVPMERLLGRGRFLALFLLSGLCGSLLSLFCSGWLGVGASGAVFGLIGGALLWTKREGARATGMNYATMLLLALTALGMGWLDTGVDNYAHLGGFLAGMVIFRFFRRKSVEKTAG